MIDDGKVLEFCNSNKLKYEEFMLLRNLYLKNEQIMPELYSSMDKYYRENSSVKFVQMIKDLEERDFLEILKDSNDNSIQIKNLKISDKFCELLFVDPEEVWEKFLNSYPSKGVMDGKEFSAKMITKDTKDNFKKYVLKGANKMEADAILYIVQEMFDCDVRGKPRNYAVIGVDRFVLNWQTIKKEWEKEQQEIIKGDWRTRQV